MEKLGQLVGQDEWDLVVVDTPPSRNALDFLDAPQRLGSFLDGRLIRLLMAPGRGIGRMVTGVMGLAMKGVSTVVGSNMLADASTFVQSFDSLFDSFQQRATMTYNVLRKEGTNFVVVSSAEPDALRESSFFVDRLRAESMPLAGLVVNRTHPRLSDFPADHAATAADAFQAQDRANGTDHRLTTGVLRIHVERAGTAKRELGLLRRFTAAHPTVPVVGVPSLPFEVSDLTALRAVGDQLTA